MGGEHTPVKAFFATFGRFLPLDGDVRPADLDNNGVCAQHERGDGGDDGGGEMHCGGSVVLLEMVILVNVVMGLKRSQCGWY